MASKAQRKAVRRRADAVHAAVGSFCKAKTILPLSGIAPEIFIEAPPAPEEVSISSVFDTKPLPADPGAFGEISEEEIRRHDRMWANLESGHTADGLNEYDLRETTQDVLDSLHGDPFADDYEMTDAEWYALHPEDDQESQDCTELNALNDLLTPEEQAYIDGMEDEYAAMMRRQGQRKS